MPKKPTAYYRPTNHDEALRLLRQPNTLPLAGGTALLASEEGIDSAVVDLQNAGLDHLSWADGGRLLRAGAMVRLADLNEFLTPLTAVEGAAALVCGAIRRAGPNTYRNAATLGGIVASRLPDSELLAALLVLNATITLRLPAPETQTLAAYLEDDERLPGLITVSGWRPDGGAIRLAAVGISPRPIPLTAAEAALAGDLSDDTIAAAGQAAAASATHPGDFRGDAAYRAEMAAVLTRRVLGALAQ